MLGAMKRIVAAATLVALTACTPPGASGAITVVQGIYATAEQNIGHAVTTIDQAPLTDDLKSLLDRAEAQAQARQEPFIEGDIALNCQDCTSISNLIVGPQTGAEQEPPVEDHTWVQATFKLNGNEDRRVLWDMVSTPEGWCADNIISDGFDLRAEARSYLDTPAP
jgi:hypothetical protein